MKTSKVVMITGANSGIGYATAMAFAKIDSKIAICSRRNSKLKELESKIIENGADVLSQRVDVTQKTESVSFAKKIIEKWGHIDVLINSAGVAPLSFIKHLKINEWEQMIDVNVKGLMYCTAAVLPHMIEKKSGHIVNLSSLAGRIVFPAGSVYCATKHAVTAFSEGLRQELSHKFNIRVSCIEPGVVKTGLINQITDKSLQRFVENTKKESALNAEDIARVILFAVNAPSHVNINELVIRPTTQEI